MLSEITPQITLPLCMNINDPTCVFVQCIDVEILDDMDIEGDHRFQIVITNVTLGSISPSEGSTVITIQDNIGEKHLNIHILCTYAFMVLFLNLCRWKSDSQCSNDG